MNMRYRIDDICYDYDTRIRQILGDYSDELTIRIVEKVFNALDEGYVEMLLGNVVFIGVTDFSDRFKSGEYFNQVSFTTSEFAVDVGLYSDNFSKVDDFDIRLDVVTHDPYTRGLSRGLLNYEFFENWSDVIVDVDENAEGLASDREFLLEKAYDAFKFVMLGNRDKLAIQNIYRVEFGEHDNGMVLPSDMYPCTVFYYFDSFGSCMSFVYGKESLEELFDNGFGSLICVNNYTNE